MHIKTLALLASFGALTLTGCSSIEPMLIDEPSRIPLTGTPNDSLMMSSISRAAGPLGWQVLEARPGSVTLCYPQQWNRRYQNVHAIVRVEYGSRTYKIVHVSDFGLEKQHCPDDPFVVCIRDDYNGWIDRLDAALYREMTLQRD
ncbi:MAG: hypothetical protein J6S08_01530 [Duodenibacillus sp.]|nr:hypothetical protein [Duodenibacillus sp.]